MKISDRNIPLTCLFCRADLLGPENAKYTSGDLIKCVVCGEENDFDGVLQVAKEKGIAEVKRDVQDQLHKQFKNLFK